MGDIRKMADSDHGLLAGERHCDRRQEQNKRIQEGLHLFFGAPQFFRQAQLPRLFGGDLCQHDSNRTGESVSMLCVIRDRVPRVEQFAAFGNLHGKSSELVDFILYARVPPEQQISPASAPRSEQNPATGRVQHFDWQAALGPRMPEEGVRRTLVQRLPMRADRAKGCDLPHNPVRFCMSLCEDRDWAIKIYRERADAVDQDQNVTYFFLKDYQEICRYMRTIGYGSKGQAETVEKQVAQELRPGTYWSLRTTVQGKQSSQDIAFFIYRDLAGDLSGSGLIVVSFDIGAELAKQFTDEWFERSDRLIKERFFRG